MADEVRKPPYAWWRTNYFCVQWCFRIQRILRIGIWPWSTLHKLREWKASQLQVESSWDAQAVGKELDMALGSPIRPQILPKIQALKARLALAEQQVQLRESLHEQQWLKEAAMYANVDFGLIQQQVENRQRAYNGELQCARECYRRGMGSREFPEFLRMYSFPERRSCR